MDGLSTFQFLMHVYVINDEESLTYFLLHFRYGFLLLENVVSEDPLSVSVAILQQFNIQPDMYQVGYTKLFFRTGQVTTSR